MASSQTAVGSTLSLWRYPVKSMMGEELYTAEVTARGLAGARVYALIDGSDGKVVSAKNPRKWPDLFYLRAALAAAPEARSKMPAVRMTLPDGTLVTSEQPDVHQILSKVLKRDVKLTAAAVPSATSEAYWPDIEGLDRRGTVTEFGLPEGTFFDCAFVHVLTTATLNKLRMLYPEGRIEVRRFRPNIVLETANGGEDFVENAWIGKVLAIGDSVRLSISRPLPALRDDNRSPKVTFRRIQASCGRWSSTIRVGSASMPQCCKAAGFAGAIPSGWYRVSIAADLAVTENGRRLTRTPKGLSIPAHFDA